MKKLFSTLLIIFILSGCASKPLELNLKKAENTALKISSIEIKDKTRYNKSKFGAFSDSVIYVKEHNELFKKEINDTISTMFKPNSNKNKLVINIEEAEIYSTMKGVKMVPIVGILFLGMDEDIFANITVSLELENENKQVIKSTSIKIQVADKLTAEYEYPKVMSKAINKLNSEIQQQTKRVFYDYL